ncbi:BCCT family transporter [Halobacillus trueperi]|uniref:BCCT family transporter n=1 Tax=Halobacillus trueperi TaxID=156205 RepID=UPI00216114A0|nr:BCCT family transporter [Halobacillus trueperi]
MKKEVLSYRFSPFLEHLPLSTLISWLILIIIYISFTTLADSLTTTVSYFTTTGNTILDPEPPARVKVFWCVINNYCRHGRRNYRCGCG